MKLPEIFTKVGRDKIAFAREEVERMNRKVERKNQLKAKEKAEFVEHQALLQRHHRFKLLAAFCGSLAVAGVGIALKFHQDNDSPATSTPQVAETVTREQEISNRIVKVDELIERVEPGFDRFKQRLTTDVQAMGGLAPYINPTVFWGPFMMVEVNRRTNNSRNYQRALNETRDGNLRLPNRGSFFYNTGRVSTAADLAPNEVRNVSAATYSVDQHTMQLADDFNPNSIMDMLVAYHEGHHCFSDFLHKRSLSGEALTRYERFVSIRQNERGRTLVEEEANAFGHEIEALNVLLRGQLRSSGGRLSIREVSDTLGTHSPRDLALIATLLQLAPLYYPQGMANGSFASAFLNQIAQAYSSMGHEVYTVNEQGAFIPFTPRQ